MTIMCGGYEPSFRYHPHKRNTTHYHPAGHNLRYALLITNPGDTLIGIIYLQLLYLTMSEFELC